MLVLEFLLGVRAKVSISLPAQPFSEEHAKWLIVRCQVWIAWLMAVNAK